MAIEPQIRQKVAMSAGLASGLAIAVLNVALRLWHLHVPAAIVFDETYYVSFALDILQGNAFFDAHPPLGKYWIALSMALFAWGRGHWQTGELAQLTTQPISFRWLNAIAGAIVPLVGGWVAWEWGRYLMPERRRAFALLSAVLLSLDGLLLADSRLALLHVPLVGFGLLGLGAWARSHHAIYPGRWRLWAGIALGASVGVKWNGAGYWLALICLEGGRGWSDRDRPAFRLRQLAIWLGIVPLITYGVSWLPYGLLTGKSLIEVHQQIWNFHQTATQAHPYQSSWYTWPLMLRPIAYFFQGGVGNVETGIGPPVPAPDTAIALYGFNSPLLAWAATAAMWLVIFGSLHRIRHPRYAGKLPTQLAVLYLAHWLPWALIQRTTFFYHYLPAALTAEMALAWVMSRWFTGDRPAWRRWAWGLLGLILAGFMFWLPLAIPWPLSLEALQHRWWLPSWR